MRFGVLSTAAALCLWAGAAVAAPVTMTPAQVLDAGFKAITAGQAAKAHDFAMALLARNPKEFLALILQSRSARALNHLDEARASARAAWQVAVTPTERYEAATVRAQALSSDQMRLAAEFWLRRAAQLAPDAPSKAAAVSAFNYVRDHSHWSLQLDASLVPSSNVNNGSAANTVQIYGLAPGGAGTTFGLSGDARALAGLVGTASATAVYRLTPTTNTLSQFNLNVVQTHNWLTAAAQAQAPTAKGSDYDYAAVEAGFSQRLRASVKSLAIYNWAVAVGHNWYGQSALSNYSRLSFGVDRQLSAKVQGGAALSVERQARLDDHALSAWVFTGSTNVTRVLGNQDQLRLSVGEQYTQSISSSINHHMVFAQASWDKAAPVWGVKLGASVSASQSAYGPDPLFAPTGRKDFQLGANVTVLFIKVQYMGFSPSLSLQWQETKSNVLRYQLRDLGVAFAIKSVF